MSMKLKVLGLGLLAVMATSAFAVMNASAEINGHFIHDDPGHHVTITGTEEFETDHSLKFQRTNSDGTNAGAPIVCTSASYTGTVVPTTVETITVTPSYSGCATTGEAHGSVQVTTNGCSYTFGSTSAASTHTPTHHATVSVVCPTGKAIVIDHPNCEITVAPQTLTGVTYTTIEENKKHALTVNVTALNIASQFHGGICIFLGTSHKFDMNGAVTVRGANTNGEQVNITAT